jgi:pyrroloquinoline quinone biosynthesis protein E
MAHLDSYPLFSERLRVRKNYDDFFVYDKKIKRGIKVNEDFIDIFGLCNGENSIKDISYLISQRRGDSINVIQEKVHSTIESLVNDKFLSIRKNKSEGKRFKINEYNFSFPLDAVYLELTKNCNFRCVHCYAKSPYSLVDTNKIKFDRYIHLIDKLDKMGTTSLCFTGGEPFLSKYLTEILSYVDSKNMEVGFLTNGSLIDNEKIEFLKKINPKFVAVSFDSHKKEIFEKIRGKNNYTKVLRNIERLLSTGINTHINCIIFNGLNDSVEHISEFLSFFNELGIYDKSVTFDEFIPEGRGEILDNYRIDEKKVAKNIRGVFKGSMSHEPKILGESSSYANSICGLGTQICCIKSNGDVALCPVLYSPQHTAGNILKNNINEIWEKSPVFEYFRGENVKKDSKCSKCDVLDQCVGGCKAKAFKFYGDFSKEDPWMCAYFEK